MVVVGVFVSVCTGTFGSAHRAQITVLVPAIVGVALGCSAAKSRTTSSLATGLAGVVSVRLGEGLGHSTGAGCAIAVGITTRRLIRVTARRTAGAKRVVAAEEGSEGHLGVCV